MDPLRRSGLPDWSDIDLVVFDVDGTLYNQRPLRIRMFAELAKHVALSRDMAVPKVIAIYRSLREELGAAEMLNFEGTLIERTAWRTGLGAERVRAIVSEWIESRPLGHLASCAVPGADKLFRGLRAKEKRIGIWSDYPAVAKLDALRLQADIVLSSSDARIQVLKPHPRGLEVIMSCAGIAAARTLVIGDRIERDGAAARRAAAWPLIRAGRARPGWPTFRTFHDAFFEPMHAA